MLAERFFPEIGGVEKHCFEISKRIVQDGHNLTIITKKTQKRTKKYEKLDGIKIYRIAQNNYFLTWINLSKFCMKFPRFDLIHCHDFVSFYWIFPFIFLNQNIYITFHGFERYPIPKINILLRKIAEYITKGNICVGRFIKKYYKTNPTCITYGGINLINKKEKIKAKKESAPKIPDKLLFIGRLEKDTGILYYIKALKILKSDYKLNLELDLCGEGRLENIIRKYTKKNNLAVNFEGFVSKIDGCIMNSGIILASSYLSILESLYNEKIVISTYQNELKKDYLELSPFSKYIMICKNPCEIAEAIANIVEKKADYEKKIKSAFHFAKTQTWDNVYNLYTNLWNSKK